VLIFPPAGGGAAAYRAILGEQGIANLKRWIEAGGTAIGVGSGSELLADKELKLTRTRLRRQALEQHPPPVWGPTATAVADGGNFRAVGMRVKEEGESGGAPIVRLFEVRSRIASSG